MTAVHRIRFKINIKILIKRNHKSLNGNILLYFVGCHWEQGQGIQRLCVLYEGPADGTPQVQEHVFSEQTLGCNYRKGSKVPFCYTVCVFLNTLAGRGELLIGLREQPKKMQLLFNELHKTRTYFSGGKGEVSSLMHQPLNVCEYVKQKDYKWLSKWLSEG